MKKHVYYFLTILTGLLTVSCEKFLEPELDNRLTGEQMLKDPAYFEGLLLHAYKSMPARYFFYEDVASDDAVTNDKASNYLKMATGEWKSTFYPLSKWTSAYNEISYLNRFLENFEQVEWSWQDPDINANHLQRLKGEAHGLRAWYLFQLLQYHAGESETGDMLGVPVITSVLTKDDDFSVPRSTYAQTIDQIMADLDTAISNLPETYVNISKDQVHNSTFGERFRNRMSGKAAKALKSRVALHAASPAFNYLSWEEAAEIAGNFIVENGGLAALAPSGVQFYRNHLDPEIIWNNSKSNSNVMEQENYPPSQYGSGRTNPTHDLVASFPMLNGFPITHPSSGFNEANPYNNRDPRLAQYIVYHGNTLKEVIYTDVGSPLDGINKQVTSTRSGYYLKKFMLDDKVNLVPGSVTSAEHFVTYLRLTEVFLNYAEAANEAWGPDLDPLNFGFTARDVISQVRSRAGLPVFASDTYLRFFVSTPEAFRDLVRNERRIEFCFEGFRFWDIRRWKLTPVMKAPVHAMVIDTESATPYKKEFLENRNYADHMIYGPIPYEETLKYDLVQNKGWN